MASRKQLLLFALILTSSQQNRAFALPTESSTIYPPTSEYKFTVAPTLFKIATSTQYPPTTSVQNTKPATTGTIVSSLETGGNPSVQPFPTAFTPVAISLTAVSSNVTRSFSSNLTAIANSTRASLALPTRHANETSAISKTATNPETTSMNKTPTSPAGTSLHKRAATDCFQPVSSGAIPSQISSRGGHPVKRLGIAPQSNPVSTNKFYANFFLGTQGQGVWTHPYSLTWSKGGGNLKSWGMAVSHIDANQRAYGPQNAQIPGSPVQYFINPIGIQSLILSANELGSSTVLTTDTLQAFSANANLLPQSGSAATIRFPLVQGMGFVTALYHNLTPSIQSAVFFKSVVQVGMPRAGVFKYRITLEDNKSWLLYATPYNGQPPNFTLVSNSQLQGVRNWSGIIQVAKNPAGASGEASYDASAGVYATAAGVSGSVSSTTGTYQIRWSKGGLQAGQKLIMYALPHHLASLDSSTSVHETPLSLQTTTKGVATAIIADVWTLVEQNLPVDMSFAPWTPTLRSKTALSASAKALINQVATSEVNQDFNAQTNLNSMYYSGKALSKFATIIYTIHDLLNEPNLATQGLNELKGAFAVFVTNKQIYPLVYDTVWQGVVSSGSYATGDSGQDFGNTYYNDHHFHYGYFIYAAAVIAYLDPNWLALNKAWVNTLVRDAGNPSTTDAQFPFSRMFDWYHGHSFAKGLFESADGKDEESSSEDAFFAYAVKMWGHVTGDSSMEARGNLMLGIISRSHDNYFLMRDSNTVQPSNFIKNKATGILFENKIDHTTYFGTNPEYIQGIHMLPLSASSSQTRSATFIQEEWTAYFSDTSFNPASKVVGGWKGILYGNLACINPRAAWTFFSQTSFDPSWIDGGASRTWYMAFSAVLGGL